MKMPKEVVMQLTAARNQAEHIFAFYRIEDEDMYTVYSKGEIEDTIFEVLCADAFLFEMFDTILEEIREINGN